VIFSKSIDSKNPDFNSFQSSSQVARKLLKKISEARRARNRRAEAYSVCTLQRGDWAQRSLL